MSKAKKNFRITIDMVPPTQTTYLQQLKEKEDTIKKLTNSDFKTISDDEIRSILRKILYYDNGDGIHFLPMNILTSEIPVNSLLYRIRTIDSLIKSDDDLWYPPSKCIRKRGRLNDIKEPVLYVAGDIGTALGEMRIKVGQEFNLLFYKVITPIKLIDISASKGMSSQYREVEEIISNFLIDEFSILVPDNENERYKVSNVIGKYYYEYKSKGLDGWIYPSAVRSGKKSIAIDAAKSKENLEFLFIAKGKLETETNFTLEQPKALNKTEDKLYLLSELVETEEINKYDIQLISDIEIIWSNHFSC